MAERVNSNPMSKCASTVNNGPTNDWIGHVTAIVCIEWAGQAFHCGENIFDGLERLIRRRPDFNERIRAIADLIVMVAPLLPPHWPVTEVDYRKYLLVPIYQALPFLKAPVRIHITLTLIANILGLDYYPTADLTLDVNHSAASSWQAISPISADRAAASGGDL